MLIAAVHTVLAESYGEPRLLPLWPGLARAEVVLSPVHANSAFWCLSTNRLLEDSTVLSGKMFESYRNVSHTKTIRWG